MPKGLEQLETVKLFSFCFINCFCYLRKLRKVDFWYWKKKHRKVETFFKLMTWNRKTLCLVQFSSAPLELAVYSIIWYAVRLFLLPILYCCKYIYWFRLAYFSHHGVFNHEKLITCMNLISHWISGWLRGSDLLNF